MKILCGILISVLSIHLQCGALCLADWFASASSHNAPASVDPPCHKHADDPAGNTGHGNTGHSHESNSRCGQGSVIEAKASADGKHLTSALPVPAILPAALFIGASDEWAVKAFLPLTPPGSSSPPLTFSTLRI